MKVKKLKKILEKIPDNFDIILSKDSEGNYFSPLCIETEYAYSIGYYIPETTWTGEFITKDQAEHENHEEYIENCVVLWPTN